MFIVVHVGGLLVESLSNEQYEDFIMVLLKETIAKELSVNKTMDSVTIHENGNISTVEVDRNSSLVFDYVLNYPEMLEGSPFLSITNLAGGIKDDLITIIKRILSKKQGLVLELTEPFYILLEVELIDRKFCLIEIEIKRKV